jgi:hypothetical protein
MLRNILFFTSLTLLLNSMTVHTSSSNTKKASIEIQPHSHSWAKKVSLAKGKVLLEVDDCTFTFLGDSTDNGQIRISISEPKRQLTFRYWPDISMWGLSEEGKEIYSKEFETIPGWQERSLHLSVDVDQSLRRFWLNDRLIREWRVSEKATPKISLNGILQQDIDLRPEQIKHIRDIPLEHYFNDNTGSPYRPDAALELDCGAQLCFESHTNMPHNLDLGQLVYREEHLKTGPFQRLSLPYVNCDAFSSDPKRAIFRVPARFYHRLHLLCFSDNDEAEIPRAAIRFMKSERARFVTWEFGLVPEEHVTVLDTVKVGDKRAVRVAVDLNPSAWQEFLTQPENEYLEFELTRPVSMDNNSFMRPSGQPSSLHVLALALEEAPASMVVTSDVAGHLFENSAKARMNIQIESHSDKEQTGTIKVEITDPDAKIRQDYFDFQLAAHSRKNISVNLSETAVGKSTFTAQLSIEDGSASDPLMERHTSFAILPEFDRVAEHSPFGMWSFIENHHGADIETTCEILRKAGVKGTLANFVLDDNPEKWKENAQRQAILNEHGIKVNWGHLAGVARTGLNGLGDLDKRFAWIKAHPQVEYYNLFWETSIAGQPGTTCPPEIRGQAPVKWDAAGQKHIETYMEFGTSWAARARQEAPDKRISFGNGFPLFTSTMLLAGFPQEYIDGFGLDFDMYTAAPEDQPSMWYAPFSGIYYLRELRKLYNCESKPIWLTEAIYCPTSPIWISERQQADYYVRAHLLALAMGVEKFGMCAEPIDPDGWYHYGHYGPVGLCHATPEMNPREAFCAYAAMTGILDGARFDQMVPLNSPHVYCLRFRKQEDTYIHALWTVNGSRRLDLQLDPHEALTVYNRDGKVITKELAIQNGKLSLQPDESPHYLVGPKHLKVLRLVDTEQVAEPENNQCLVQFESLDDWHVQVEPLEGYEAINQATPLAWTMLDLRIENKTLRIRPPKASKSHPLETICMVLQHTGESLRIPETAEAIGVRARGDRSWGRVVFVLEDNNGNRWVSARSQTPVDVDGKIYLETQLPKAPSDNQAGYIGYSSWQREKNDLVPEYPMQLTHLLFETRTHVIHGPELVPLSNSGFVVKAIELR